MQESKSRRIAFSNRYMFNRVMLNESICKGVIEAVLGIHPARVDYLNAEQALEVAPDSHGIRMDVYAESSGIVYDIEMQAHAQFALGKRFRYYQGAIDTSHLRRSQTYGELPESYIVFLCLHDPFCRSLPVYSFERSCKENADVNIDCGSHWRVLNASAWEEEGTEDLRNLLRYLQTGETADDPLIRRIEAEVEAANEDARWSDMVWSVTTIEENDRQQRIMQLREAREQGEQRVERLVSLLLDDNRIDDIRRQTNDVEYRNSLFEKYGI